jgi:hypothetical protein
LLELAVYDSKKANGRSMEFGFTERGWDSDKYIWLRFGVKSL